MNLDLTQHLNPLRGEPVSLKHFLVELLEQAPGQEKSAGWRMVRLAARIEGESLAVELKDDDLKLIEAALDGRPNLLAWVRPVLEYLLWPDRLAESDRALIAKRYAAHFPANGTGQSPSA